MFRGDAPLFLFLSFCGLLTACFLLLRFHLVPLVFFFLRLIGRYLLFQLLNIPFVVLDIRVRRGFFLFFSSFVSSVLLDSVRVNLGESLCSLVLLDGVAFVSLLIL